VDRPLIVVAGENLVDRIVGADGSVHEVPGGGPFNTVRALARLGSRVAYLGRISTDPRGRALRRALADDGVDLSLAVMTDDPTLVAHAALDATGAATYRFDWVGSAAAGLRPADVTSALPGDTAALHIGTLGLALEPIGSTLEGLVVDIPPGVLVMTDPNIRSAAIDDERSFRARLDRMLARTDVVKASVDDLLWLDPGRDPVETARALLERGPSVVLLTDGGRPLRIVTASTRPVALAIPAVRVVDTIGAGDAFGAGFLAAWTRSRSRHDLDDMDAIEAAAAFGIRVAAWTVTRAGADPPRAGDLDGAARVAAHDGPAGDPMR
jgi:fructokinase